MYHRSLASISAAKLSGGKSEAFMFKTDDKRFVLKTMSGTEFKQLSRMMMVPRSRRRSGVRGSGNRGGAADNLDGGNGGAGDDDDDDGLVDLEDATRAHARPLNPGHASDLDNDDENLRANRKPFWK